MLLLFPCPRCLRVKNTQLLELKMCAPNSYSTTSIQYYAPVKQKKTITKTSSIYMLVCDVAYKVTGTTSIILFDLNLFFFSNLLSLMQFALN